MALEVRGRTGFHAIPYRSGEGIDAGNKSDIVGEA
jgi:hypothetical protein